MVLDNCLQLCICRSIFLMGTLCHVLGKMEISIILRFQVLALEGQGLIYSMRTNVFWDQSDRVHSKEKQQLITITLE